MSTKSITAQVLSAMFAAQFDTAIKPLIEKKYKERVSGKATWKIDDLKTLACDLSIDLTGATSKDDIIEKICDQFKKDLTSGEDLDELFIRYGVKASENVANEEGDKKDNKNRTSLYSFYVSVGISEKHAEAFVSTDSIDALNAGVEMRKAHAAGKLNFTSSKQELFFDVSTFYYTKAAREIVRVMAGGVISSAKFAIDKAVWSVQNFFLALFNSDLKAAGL